MTIVEAVDKYGQIHSFEFDETVEPIEGGEGNIYFTVDRRWVVKYYHENMLAQKDPTALRKILSFGPSPGTAEYELFGWPEYMIEDDSIIIGIVMRNVALHTWFHELIQYSSVPKFKVFATKKPECAGTFEGRVRAAIEITKAIKYLNLNGMTSGDISGRNFLINPVEGRAVLIDLDGLTVEGAIQGAVKGTPMYMAPELEAGQLSRPDVYSDRHALAVVLYSLLLMNHPLLDGKIQDNSLGNSPQEHNHLALGEKALYIEHPTKHQNEARHPKLRASILTKKMQECFQKSFVDGLHGDRRNRTQHATYEIALEGLLKDLVRCQNPACPFGYFPSKGYTVSHCPICDTLADLSNYKVVEIQIFRPDAEQRRGLFEAKQASVVLRGDAILAHNALFPQDSRRKRGVLQFSQSPKQDHIQVELLGRSREFNLYMMDFKKHGELLPLPGNKRHNVPQDVQLIVQHTVHGSIILEFI